MNYSILLVVLFIIGLVHSDSIAIFGTGLNADGSLSVEGSSDLHWTLSSTPYSNTPASAIVSGNDHPYSYPSHSNGQWIGSAADLSQSFAVGYFTYTTTFDLTGLNPNTASLSGTLSVDDTSSIILNGVNTGSGCLGSGCWNYGTAFAINGGFIAGVNTLTFQTYNTGGPAGLQVAISGTASPNTPDAFCANANQADWTPYGQGYYCWNGNAGFIQCWGAAPFIQSAYQPCAAGTTCRCANAGPECSNHGTETPCI